jgi:hypothetical protein
MRYNTYVRNNREIWLMPKPRHVLLVALLVLALLVGYACSPGASVRHFAASSHSLQQPFLRAWERLGGDALGPPRSAPLWLNGQQVQLFDELLLAAAPTSMPLPASVEAHTFSAGWLDQLPPELTTLPAAPQRAELALSSDTSDPRFAVHVEPLRPITLTLLIGNYSGPAELRLYDANLAPAGVEAFAIRDGAGQVSFLPRGAVGPQWLIVLVENRIASVYNNRLLLRPTTQVHTGVPDLDALYPTVRGFLEQEVVSYELDGYAVRGYRSPDNPLIWLRDHVYQGRGFRYHEADMTSVLDAFQRAQLPDGSFPDVLAYPGRNDAPYRVEPESDLEFLYVLGVYQAWQATGDDAWLASHLDSMRRGLDYITSDPLRWDAELGLVRRPYTIDTWDFEYGPTTADPITGQPSPRHWIDEQTRWGIFHGDNTGLAYALRLMSRIERHLGNSAEAERWDTLRREVKDALLDVSWNGNFFTHFVPLEGELDVPGVDTDAQLSLSNTYALNREFLEYAQGRNIIQTYFSRRNFDRAFAEWYSIDPPFPPGSIGMGGRKGENPGEYVNGGIMPLVGGELARGAFRYGEEEYGFDILRRYADLLRLTGESYLWYYPDGRPGISGPDTLASDGWGSSAMVAALLEGAAGVVDTSSRYADLELSPRWAAAPDIERAYVVARYGASDGYVAYTWQRHAAGLALDLTGSWRTAHIRLLLPDEVDDDTVTVAVDGQPVETSIRRVGGSSYVLVDALGGNVAVSVAWEE